MNLEHSYLYKCNFSNLIIFQQFATLLVLVVVTAPVEIKIPGNNVEHHPLLNITLPPPAPPPEIFYPPVGA